MVTGSSNLLWRQILQAYQIKGSKPGDIATITAEPRTIGLST
jgi:hypothetical protein